MICYLRWLLLRMGIKTTLVVEFLAYLSEFALIVMPGNAEQLLRNQYLSHQSVPPPPWKVMAHLFTRGRLIHCQCWLVGGPLYNA